MASKNFCVYDPQLEMATKRVRTHEFANNEEAVEYLDSLLLGRPELPLEVWIKILSINTELSVSDIKMMCSVNSHFKALCNSGIIWDAILKRQFNDNPNLVQKIFQEIPDDGDFNTPLYRLMTLRVTMNPDPSLRAKSWVFRKGSLDRGDKVIHFLKARLYKQQLLRQLAENVLEFRLYDITRRGDSMASKHNLKNYISDLTINQTGLKFLMEPRIDLNMIEETSTWFWKGMEGIQTSTTSGGRRMIYNLLRDGWIASNHEEVALTGDAVDCIICGSQAKSACGRCGSVYYCGLECAKQHWKGNHEKECKKI